MPPLDWQNVIARLEEIIRLFSSTSILFPRTTWPQSASGEVWVLGHMQMESFRGPEGSLE